jgi:hypothetical protein
MWPFDDGDGLCHAGMGVQIEGCTRYAWLEEGKEDNKREIARGKLE